MKWLSVAATNGNANAQYNLGMYYYELKPSQYDLEKAKYWFDKAAKNRLCGCSSAIERD